MASLSDATYDLDELGAAIVESMSYKQYARRHREDLIAHQQRQHEPEEFDTVRKALEPLWDRVESQVADYLLWEPTGEMNYVFDRWLPTGDMVIQAYPY